MGKWRRIQPFPFPYRLDDRRLGNDPGIGQKTEAEIVCLLEKAFHVGSEFHLQSRVAAFVAKRHTPPDFRRLDPLVPQGLCGFGGKLGQRRFEVMAAQASLAKLDHIGQSHAVGAEDSSQWMDQDPADAERVGDQAGMLPAGAAEAYQGISGHIMAACDRDLLDRIGHVFDGDSNEPFGHSDRRLPGLVGDLRATLESGCRVDRLVAANAKDMREMFWADLAED